MPPRITHTARVAGDDDRVEAQNGALEALAEHNREVDDAVLYRWFCGQSVEVTAELMSISTQQVKRCTAYGKVRLAREIQERLKPDES